MQGKKKKSFLDKYEELIQLLPKVYHLGINRN